MNKTNTGLVAYVKYMIGAPYWYGCFGQTSTKALYNAKKRQYPNYYNWSCPASQLGKKVFDCVGLIKGYLWSTSITSEPKYNAAQDVSANGMYEKCKKKGHISTMPNVVGVLVFKNGHVGVYIGNNTVVEAKGHAYGVITSKLTGGYWTHWGYCPWIEYTSTEPPKTSESNKTNIAYYPKCKSSYKSIVDALDSIGVNSKYTYRKKIAIANGIKNYTGKAQQNIDMLNMLKAGKLKKP